MRTGTGGYGFINGPAYTPPEYARGRAHHDRINRRIFSALEVIPMTAETAKLIKQIERERKIKAIVDKILRDAGVRK